MPANDRAGIPRGDWNYSGQLNRIEVKLDLLLSAVRRLGHTENQILGQELAISKKENEIMAFVKVDSDKIDGVVTELGAVADAVQTLIDSPDNNLTEDDLSEVTAPLDALRDKLAALSTPVEPAPDA